ncbi:cell wall-binding repeat-containing protein [Jeotgalibacillus proteolyticus]|uniref:cell wall-binding repeat-containing protein n=1 Tax=Jeotgalibacillus proteolyticus TaxID=2082395 RepID=UPI003CF252E2
MKSKWGMVSSMALVGSLLVSQSALATGESPVKNSGDLRMNKAEEGFSTETEPNNSFDQSNHITVDDIVSGTLVKDDRDYFTFEVDSSESVYFFGGAAAVNETTEMDLKVELFNEERDAVTVDEEYGEDGELFEFGVELEPGTYYLAVSDENNVTDEEEYLLFSSFITDEPTIDRISGSDRYETAVEIAKAGWYEGDTSELILATGMDFPDALAASPLAYSYGAPILLTKKDTIPDVVKEAISYFDPEHITIIGGSKAVSYDVQTYLEETMEIDTDRISGENRYETAAMIAAELPGDETAYVVNGSNYPDALSIAPYAASMESPILLTRADVLPEVTESALEGFNDSWAVGGTLAISNEVMGELPKAKRVAGKDRYATSVQIVKQLKMDASYVSLATGENFADALTGSVLSAQYGEPVLLTKKNSLPASVKKLFKDRTPYYYTLYGGTLAISKEVEEELMTINR